MKILLCLVPLVLTGCASVMRPLTDVALGAGGAALGHHLSDGNLAATAAGAGLGVAIGEGVHAWKSRSDQKAYAAGFQKGRADGVKFLFFNLQSEQRNAPGPHQEFGVRMPFRREGGVFFNATTNTIHQ